MGVVRSTVKGQMLIPAPLRKKYKIVKGTLLHVYDEENRIVDYKLRQKDPKRKTVEALQGMQYQVIAMGDSYNDISMLQQAEVGILFCPPDNVIKDFPDLPVVYDYVELKKILAKYI